MTLAELVVKKDEKLQEFLNSLNNLNAVRNGLYDLLESYDAKISTLANSADLYPHLHDDLEAIKTILQDYNALPTHLCRSIDTLQHLLRKYMGY